MKKLKIVGIILALFVGWYWLMYPSGSWNHRVTLVVETPEGVKSGRAVRSLTVIRYPEIAPQMLPHTETKGEAVVIDLGKKGLLFGLLRSPTSVDGAKYLFLYSFRQPGKKHGSTTSAGVRHYSRLKSGTKVEIEPKYLPMLVRFKDINDPKSVELVDPTNLAATYGAGYKLKSATIEITDDPVTTGIEKVLPWLGPLKGRYLGGGRTSRTAPLELHGGNFKMGDYK